MTIEKSKDAFRTISEVAEALEVPAHVLRFWESRFTQVKPVKRAGGRRYYRRSDIALLDGIRKLLHDDGLTIRGVQKMLREDGVRAVAALGRSQDEDTAEPALEAGSTPGAEADAPMAEDVQQVTEPSRVLPFARPGADAAPTEADPSEAAPPKADTPEAAPPEVDTSEAAPAEADTSEAAPPEADTVTSALSEAAQPRAPAPEADLPENAEPDLVEAEAAADRLASTEGADSAAVPGSTAAEAGSAAPAAGADPAAAPPTSGGRLHLDLPPEVDEPGRDAAEATDDGPAAASADSPDPGAEAPARTIPPTPGLAADPEDDDPAFAIAALNLGQIKAAPETLRPLYDRLVAVRRKLGEPGRRGPAA